VERADRLVITLVATGLSGLHEYGVPYIEWLRPIALWWVAVGSAITLWQRMRTVYREAAEADALESAHRGGSA
jgi:CDP-diacylglycerol--glycerol-3-phosphate 3-phosphatidyltransferase